jgi:hypothetical protein
MKYLTTHNEKDHRNTAFRAYWLCWLGLILSEPMKEVAGIPKILTKNSVGVRRRKTAKLSPNALLDSNGVPEHEHPALASGFWLLASGLLLIYNL